MTKLYISILIVLLPVTVLSQIKISGFVKDAQSGEMLIGATIWEENTTNGTTTSSNGYFSLLCHGNIINFSFIGYKTISIKFDKDTLVSVYLEPGQELNEIKVTADRVKKFNINTLTVKELNNIPAIGGKPDVLKTLQLLPGIQSQAEGTSLINVRGGNPGENLYLIDNVQLLYVNHLGGFMSVFNPDMINSMEVYKGGFPAKYGGKLSSVMAITQREGNNKQWKGNLGIGITDASFSVEGPLIKDKASIVVTGRKTLIDYPMMLISVLTDQSFILYYGFYDINAKVSYRPNNKNSYHINLYMGNDYINYSSIVNNKRFESGKINNKWGSWMLSGRWNTVVTPRLFVNNILSTTNYQLKTNYEYKSYSEHDSIEYDGNNLSLVNDLSFRSDWQYKVSMNYNVEFGAKMTTLGHIPNKTTQINGVEQEYEHIRSFENAAYVGNQIHLFNFIDANIGLRVVNFQNKGYSKTVLEPRVIINANLNPNHSINFTYQKMSQFAHLLFSSGTVLNNEIWVPVDKNLEPSGSTQFGAGWKASFRNGEYDLELGVYHKSMDNLATYKEGYSNLLGDGGWRNKLETGGTGKSKGIELLLRKKQGDWTGFIAYSFSKTTRRFSGINGNDEYLFEFDRPHVASINISRKLSAKWSANATWVYQTGLPYTPVIGRQYIPDGIDGFKEALIYGKRNSDRMENYHRLDLGFIKTISTKRGRKAEWNFSVYNAYNRHNPSAYYYSGLKKDFRIGDWQGDYLYIKKYKVSFFPIIPTISYKLYFDGKPKTNNNNENKSKNRFLYNK
jgi:hypothetical protein